MGSEVKVIQKGFFFRSKLAQIKFKGNKCAQFSSFLILLKKCGKKSDSSLRSRNKFTKDFHVKKIYMGILCKLNTNQNYVQFFSNFFCWRSVVNLQGNSFIKYMREIFFKGFPCKKEFLCNIFKEVRSIIREFLTKICQRFVLESVKPTLPYSCTCCLLIKEKQRKEHVLCFKENKRKRKDKK